MRHPARVAGTLFCCAFAAAGISAAKDGSGQKVAAQDVKAQDVAAQDVAAQDMDTDLANASLEQLTQMQIRVSSFARKDQDLWKTPAAVFVLTKEEITRASFSSIPELLRMVPGMQVAQVDASTWAVSARGFNSIYAGKLLVLVDGRTVYSEIYSGAHWDQIDIPLQDIERIEVIRGSGAATWGTNAVNGVVNIITKHARQSARLSLSGRTSRIGETVHLRFGGILGTRTQYRSFFSYVERQPFDLPTGKHAFDGEDILRGGGRIDWQKSASDWITASGDAYDGNLKQQIFPQVALPIGPDGHDSGTISGSYVLGRWEHKFKPPTGRARGADTALQFYYDDQARHELGSDERVRTADLDFQNHFLLHPRSDVVWGVEYRFTADHLAGAILPTTRSEYRNYLVDFFIQNEIALVPDRLIATLGTKVQQGTLAGFEVQPSARILWAPDPRQSLWLAVSRAAVAPSIEDKYLMVPLDVGKQNGLPLLEEGTGNPHFLPEILVGEEAGYRLRINRDLTLDLAAFKNNYRRLQSTLLGAALAQSRPAPSYVMSQTFVNGFKARTMGAEGSLSWKPAPAFSLLVNYEWMQAEPKQTLAGAVSDIDPWNAPHNSVAAIASWDFTRQWSANSLLSHVGMLDASVDSRQIPAYTRVDFHLSRKIGSSLKLDAGGTNLLTPRHLEFGPSTGFNIPSLVPRSLFIKAIWSF